MVLYPIIYILFIIFFYQKLKSKINSPFWENWRNVTINVKNFYKSLWIFKLSKRKRKEENINFLFFILIYNKMFHWICWLFKKSIILIRKYIMFLVFKNIVNLFIKENIWYIIDELRMKTKKNKLPNKIAVISILLLKKQHFNEGFFFWFQNNHFNFVYLKNHNSLLIFYF